jgi:hypothetical protein
MYTINVAPDCLGFNYWRSKMCTTKLIATALTAAVLSVGGASAQSSDVSGEVLTSVQIVVEAPKVAIRQTVQDLVEELTAAGFTYIEIHRTFLGRARIVAYSATEIREVIINPTTGEVLRDLAQENIENLPEQANAHADAAGENGNKGGNSTGHGNGNGNANANAGGGGGN